MPDLTLKDMPESVYKRLEACPSPAPKRSTVGWDVPLIRS